MTPSPSDKDLALLVAARHAPALAELRRRHEPLLRKVAFGVLHCYADAEDAASLALLSLWLKPQAYDAAKGEVLGWLIHATRCRALDLRRRREARDKTAAACAEHTPTDGAVAPVIFALDTVAAETQLQQAIAALPVAQRTAVQTQLIQGLTQSEAARATGVSLGTHKTRIAIAMRRLKAAYGKGPRVGQRPHRLYDNRTNH